MQLHQVSKVRLALVLFHAPLDGIVLGGLNVAQMLKGSVSTGDCQKGHLVFLCCSWQWWDIIL